MSQVTRFSPQVERARGVKVDLSKARFPHYGRYLEEFVPGQVFVHPRGFTFQASQMDAFARTYMQCNPLYLNHQYAVGHGFAGVPASVQMVFNVVLSLGVQNDSEKAMANLGYYNAHFLRPVYAGDTIRALTKVVDRKERGPGKPGIVTIRTLGVNQRNEAVLQYQRKIMVEERGERAQTTPLPAPVEGVENRFAWAEDAVAVLPDFPTVLPAGLTGPRSWFEDFAQGDIIVHANGRTITSEHLQQTYAVGNTHPLHFDRVYSQGLSGKMSGEPIVYGGLVFAWLEGLASRDVSENSVWELGFTEGYHTQPVVEGDTIGALSRVLEVHDAPNGLQERFGLVTLQLIGVKNISAAQALQKHGADLFLKENDKKDLGKEKLADKIFEIERRLLVRKKGLIVTTTETKRDKPWLMRTYSGHSSARASNALYRTNLAKGQTGLSVAFDLPTQTGYDADSPLARGEVGKVGVPISHIEDMDQLFDQIPLDQMNTSMTINATAPWLLALYIALAQRRGIDPKLLSGTTQNDIIKEYLSRGTYIYPPGPSMRLIADTINYTVKHVPKWNPTNICSYHLQEAGATPVQELAYALSTATAVLDRVMATGEIAAEQFAQVVERISFFVNAGIRFVEETCKMRAFGQMWDEITRDRYRVSDAKARRFRYGVQVNSLGLTESQPENNVQRIVLEMLAVVLSKNSRARAVQLPAWNEAMGLPRPWDQQWALRMQQVMAYETDLLEYGDIFDGSPVIAAKVDALIEGARAEMQAIEAQGGMIAAIESGYVKRELVRSHMNRLRSIEAGELKIIGVNCFRESAESPLTAGGESSIMKVDPAAEREQIERLQAHRAQRDANEVRAALDALTEAARSGENIMPSSIRCALAGVTTGEWGNTLRAVFGEYRPPTGIDIATNAGNAQGNKDIVGRLRERVRSTGVEIGRPLKLLVGKPGLDGHSNGAEQIAVKARDVGFEVVYDGIRLTPQQLAQAAQEEGVHMLGLSILSGSHMELVASVLDELRMRDLGTLPVIAGGIIPLADADKLTALGVKAVYTPKDFDLNAIMAHMVDIVRASHGMEPLGRID